jgi:hypothetical protein
MLIIVRLTTSKDCCLFKSGSSFTGMKMRDGSITTRELTFMRIIQGTTRGSLPKDTIIQGMKTIRRMIFKNNHGKISFVTTKKTLIGRSQSPSIARISSIAATMCTRLSIIIEVLKLYIEEKISCHDLDLLY